MYGKTFVVRQTKTARQGHLFAENKKCTTKEPLCPAPTQKTHAKGFLIKSKFYIEKSQNYQMA
jgi:hypothetical protein